MGSSEIDLRALKAAVDAVLDHLIDDVGVELVQIDDTEDFYWDWVSAGLRPETGRLDAEAGRLSDDVDFVRSVRREESGAASYNLVHIAPLLRFIGGKIKR